MQCALSARSVIHPDDKRSALRQVFGEDGAESVSFALWLLERRGDYVSVATVTDAAARSIRLKWLPLCIALCQVTFLDPIARRICLLNLNARRANGNYDERKKGDGTRNKTVTESREK